MRTEYILQSRWRLEGDRLICYGLCHKPYLTKGFVRINRRQVAIIGSLPRALSDREIGLMGKLMGAQVVRVEEYREVPRRVSDARFCTRCAANDFMIPGLEFDADGLCPLCATETEAASLCSVLPVMNTFPRSRRSRFDVALFYTGGKDSTYLLHYLSKRCGLRVLALTWEIPFMSDSARQSIENAKKCFTGVEFITRAVSQNDLRTIYQELYRRAGNCCACPSLAYVLFYPEMVANRVPYFVAGNEPSQMLGLYYNRMAPKFAYRFAKNKPLNWLLNLGRALTLRPPLRTGQLQTLMTVRQLAYGDHPLKRFLGYRNELVENVVAALHRVPSLLLPLKRAIRFSDHTGNIPAFVHVDLDAVAGGSYDWSAVRDTIARECGWVPPREDTKGLHTSCSIEKCKEFSQFIRFYRMESRMIPFSALEIALASRDKCLSREAAIKEIEVSLGFSLTPPQECELMKAFLVDGEPVFNQEARENIEVCP